MFDSGIPSNKPVFGETSQYAGPTLGIVLDKASVTYATADEDERKHIAGTLMDAKKDGFSKLVNYGSSKRYKINAIYHLENEAKILFQAQPRKASDAPLRIEFNPALCGASGIAEVKFLCESLVKHGWNGILTKGRVSRYDIALDVRGIHINDLIVAPMSCVRSFLVLGQTGQIQTVYLGSPKSKAFYRIYDKQQQLKDTSDIADPGKWTRIERTVKSGPALSNLENVENPFSKLLVTDLSFHVPGIEHHWVQIFKIAMRAKGGSCPFAPLPKSLRKLIRDSMKQQAAHWYKPNHIFEMWSHHLKELGLLTNQQGVHAKTLKPGIHFGGG